MQRTPFLPSSCSRFKSSHKAGLLLALVRGEAGSERQAESRSRGSLSAALRRALHCPGEQQFTPGKGQPGKDKAERQAKALQEVVGKQAGQIALQK